MRHPLKLEPSARAFLDEARRTSGVSAFDRLHGYAYARWCYLYIAVAKGEHPLSKAFGLLFAGLAKLFGIFGRERPSHNFGTSFAEGYHGKVMLLDSARRVINVGREVQATAPEHVIPYAKARDIVLESPGMIAALDCPCRAASKNPCLPLDVCLIIGEPFVSLMLELHPKRARRIDAAEAVAILKAEADRGHAHHAFFKDAMLGRFYAICNCCPCCCGAIQAHKRGIPMLASSGYVCRASERCSGCFACQAACPFGALSIRDDRAVVDEALCMGCGACLSKCARQALRLEREPSKGEPLEIETLMESGGREM